MGYFLPRALIVLIAWGVTCALIRSVWWSADQQAFFVAGAFWACVAAVYFVYVRKLRREIDMQRQEPYRAKRSPI